MPITRTWDSASYSLGLGTLPVRPPYSHRVTGALLAQLPGALCQDQARGRQGRGKRVGGWVDAGTRVPGRRELPNLLRQRTRRPGLRGSCFQIWKRRGNPPGQAPTSAFGKKKPWRSVAKLGMDIRSVGPPCLHFQIWRMRGRAGPTRVRGAAFGKHLCRQVRSDVARHGNCGGRALDSAKLGNRTLPPSPAGASGAALGISSGGHPGHWNLIG